MHEYKITIRVPNELYYIPINIKFDSREQMDTYIKMENSACKQELIALQNANTKEARKAAYIDLYYARRAFFLEIYVRKVDKEIKGG